MAAVKGACVWVPWRVTMTKTLSLEGSNRDVRIMESDGKKTAKLFSWNPQMMRGLADIFTLIY